MEDVYIKNVTGSDDQIDLIELFSIIYKAKWIIASITASVSIIGVIYSLQLPNIYESKALLAPSNTSSSIAGALSNYKGLAGIAGVNIPFESNEGNAPKALKKIESLSFFEKSILTNIYLPDLMAVSSWNPKTNSLVYNEKVFNTNTNTWVQSNLNSPKKIPSAQRSFNVFKSNHLSLNEQKNSGFITLSIKHQSPHVAEQWAQLVVNEINNFYRQQDKLESEKAVSYLNQQISMTTLSEIQEVLAQLLQEEAKKLTLIEANKYYVFEYIDPPAVMESKSEPNRMLIAVLSGILGVILGILFVLIRHYIFGLKTS